MSAKLPRAVPELSDKLRARFLTKIRVTDSGCHEWSDYLTWAGYGQFRIGERKYPAHRVAYVIENGAIHEGLSVDHLCRNRACVNPAHLEPVTHTENVRRAQGKTHCKHGHALVAENRDAARSCIQCRRRRSREYARRQIALRKAKRAA